MVRDPYRLFLTLLGIVYALAFGSYAGQVIGLIGSGGILPVTEYLDSVHKVLGPAAYWQVPTLLWLNSTDTALRLVCWAGIASSALVIAGILRRTALIACYLLYLSLVTTGQEFMSFQWDMLLLEAGFLGIFFDDSELSAWLCRWLLFRLMFLSGAVKLLSGDEAWRNLTALQFHFWTQPIPNAVAWCAAQLPHWVLKAATVATLVIELAAPFLFFGPRMFRVVGGVLTVFLQITIFLTGNYTFFNILAIALCVPLLMQPHVRWRSLPAAAAILIAPLSLGQLWIGLTGAAPPLLGPLLGTLSPFGIANSYGLFAVMTTNRPEIIVEGSADGQTWLEYEFRYKPGNLRRYPPQVAPHQPRLDWQMWFAALGTLRQNPWFVNFAGCLLRNSPDVVRLLAHNPFPNAAPRYVRATLYEYEFTTREEHSQSGEWWKRRRTGMYMQEISLEMIR